MYDLSGGAIGFYACLLEAVRSGLALNMSIMDEEDVALFEELESMGFVRVDDEGKVLVAVDVLFTN
jgi:hypothetical protein